MVGYATPERGCKLLEPQAKRIVFSRDVTFGEIENHDEASSCELDSGDTSNRSVTLELDSGKVNPPLTQDSSSEVTDPSGSGSSSRQENQANPLEESQEVRRSTRVRRPPAEWWKSTVALVSTNFSDPRTSTEAILSSNSNQCNKASNSEYESLITNNTRKIVPRPNNRNVVSCKWVFKTKEEPDPNGSVVTRYKARLVARGFSHVEGIEYYEIFAPVVKFTSIRIMLALSAALDLELNQMDVVTAFLNGELDEGVYMELPEGFEVGDPNKFVCLLTKALYGLKQAPIMWYAKIDGLLIDELGFMHNPADDCVYIKLSTNDVVVIAMNVDDLLIASSNMKLLEWIETQFKMKFNMKDLREAKTCLGFEIKRDRASKRLWLTQTGFARKIVERFGLSNAKSMSTPMGVYNNISQGEERKDLPYREAVGSVMYLVVGTRLDLK